MRDSVFLVGPMGAGKTSVGKELAVRLGKPFLDTDAKICADNQLSISEIFNSYGELYFRQQEAVCLEKVTKIPNLILATGGGCVEHQASRIILSARGVVVYLQVSPQQQIMRLAGSTDRPLLPLLSHLQHRNLLYSEVADIVVRTCQRSVSDVVDYVVTELEKFNVYYSGRFGA